MTLSLCSYLPLVAPHAGAWIETEPMKFLETLVLVAPHAGAWIETFRATHPFSAMWMSLPTRERGLKLINQHYFVLSQHVAPHAGAWIETMAIDFIN